MKYVLNEPLKEYRNKRHTDKTRTKLTETTPITPTSIHKNKTKQVHFFMKELSLTLCYVGYFLVLVTRGGGFFIENQLPL